MSFSQAKEELLVKKIKELGKIAVAYSGGIDSTYLLKVALDTLGSENVLAIVMNSELFSDEEFNKAVDLADDLGAQVLGLEMSELAEPKIAANTPESWYYSKKLLYKTMKEYASKEGFDVLADGMIMDDNDDFRPGLKARTEEGVISLLQKANLYKREVRELAKEAGISNWNKVASCSVASRFPYGTTLTLAAVNRVFAGEKFLRNAGFPVVRVRVHGDLARIEVPENQFMALLSQKEAVAKYMEEIGFDYVALDVQGFKSGRMNDVLEAGQKKLLA